MPCYPMNTCQSSGHSEHSVADTASLKPQPGSFSFSDPEPDPSAPPDPEPPDPDKSDPQLPAGQAE